MSEKVVNAKTHEKSFRNTLIIVSGIVLLGLIYLTFDYLKGRSRLIDCGSDKRYSIDIRQFETQNSAYSLELQVSVQDKAKVSAKSNPVQLQQLSEALQSSAEFRKFVVNGYNACALSGRDYQQLESAFQVLDHLARQITILLGKSSLSSSERQALSKLIDDYVANTKAISPPAQNQK